jgi:hypothetical protein
MLENSSNPPPNCNLRLEFGCMFQFKVNRLCVGRGGRGRAYAAKLKNRTCPLCNKINQSGRGRERLFILSNTNEETNGKGEHERHCKRAD